MVEGCVVVWWGEGVWRLKGVMMMSDIVKGGCMVVEGK